METEAEQLRRYVIAPTLHEMGLWSQDAEDLLIGTAAHESNGFKALHQYGGGPALSFYQIEPATHDDLWLNSLPWMRHRIPKAIAALEGRVAKRYALQPPADYLMFSLGYATAICRLLYYRVSSAIPADLEGLAAYWKRYYNTRHGSGQASEWLNAYARYCQ